MHICHIALQGCLRLDNVEYGVSADTGGHIKYLLELAQASAADPAVDRIDIVTRGFVHDKLGQDYAPGRKEQSGLVHLHRLDDGDACYLPKEQLWQRHEQLGEAFLAYLRSLDRMPTLIHAHYADAGILARRAKKALGIPYIFTGHSLGAVKQQATGGVDDPDLSRRIAIEEEAVAEADAIIASSRDEAEAQYAHYSQADGGRIRVIPPGCDLSRFVAAKPTQRVRDAVARFLRDPAKPIVLAIARPVRKKNLLALVNAYAADAALQEHANLVIVAGCRGLIGELEQECRQVFEDLLQAIDAHDLYGRVAYPKRHDPTDIPAYFALARETGGVFVNPALNEPFGLTLLEAAAARLPVIATDSGGPNDIIERCGNGLLVCPTDEKAIAQACRTIISDRRQWVRYASAGGDAVKAYDWAAHCRTYHGLVEELTGTGFHRSATERLLVCDIDNTLLGDRAALRHFLDWQEQHRDHIALGIATGRSFHSAQAILAAEGVPIPDVIISSVGTQIHWYDRDRRRYVEDTVWRDRIDHDWDGEAVMQKAQALGLRPQSRLEQRTGKASFFLEGADVGIVEQGLAESGFAIEVIASHGRYVDFLPKGFGKGTAVGHVAETMGLCQAQVVVAGDSGNDLTMLRSCPHPIIVGNWSDDVADEPALSHAYVAKASHAAGVLEGVRHYQSQGAW